MIVPLLFVPNNEDTLLPSAPEPILGRDAGHSEDRSFDISTEGDLPFHNVYFGAGTGIEECRPRVSRRMGSSIREA